MTDAIEITGIQCYGFHGVHAEERRLGQRFVLDLVLELDLQPAGSADDLGRGVDYSAITRSARAVVEGEPSLLIEAVAERIASQMLRDFPLVAAVQVCVHKPHAPIAGPPVADVAVRIRRARML